MVGTVLYALSTFRLLHAGDERHLTTELGAGYALNLLLYHLAACLPPFWRHCCPIAQNFWTVPEVVAEIRDKKARHHLQALPFELKLREPSDEAMKFGEAWRVCVRFLCLCARTACSALLYLASLDSLDSREDDGRKRYGDGSDHCCCFYWY